MNEIIITLDSKTASYLIKLLAYKAESMESLYRVSVENSLQNKLDEQKEEEQ